MQIAPTDNQSTSPVTRPTAVSLTDEEVVAQVRAGNIPLFEILMRRYNQRLFRATRAILRNDTEAEDAVQQAYLNAYQHLAQFEGRARFLTWLTPLPCTKRSPEDHAATTHLSNPATTSTSTTFDQRQPIQNVRRTSRSWVRYWKPPLQRCLTVIAPSSCCERSTG